ncbi:MAG TPA: substrate-binding domain-containing protein, partial [Solirubrobacterales bacterium]|nr:substrate-binding domain-containing protein [Solirubrobacterales bacterium]
DGIAVVTDKGTAIDCMTTDQLREIFGPDADARTFRDVDPRFPATPMTLFTPGEESGTFDFFTEEVNGEEGAQRTEGVQTSADDNQLVTGVSGTRGGIGYFGYEYFTQNEGKLNATAVDGGSGCVRPSPKTIQDGSYRPLSRPIFMYPSEKSLARPEVREFMRFTVANAPRIAEAAKIVPMTGEQVSDSRRSLERLTGR